MSKKHQDLQGPSEDQPEFGQAPGEMEETAAPPLEYQEPQFEEPVEEELEEGGEDQAEIHYGESDWRHEIQTECKRVMESLNPEFYEMRKALLQDADAEPEIIPAEITTLFFSPENLLRLIRMSNKGVSWTTREEANIRHRERATKVNYHEKWTLLGHAAPEGPNLVPIMCFRTEGKNGVSTLEFRVA